MNLKLIIIVGVALVSLVLGVGLLTVFYKRR